MRKLGLRSGLRPGLEAPGHLSPETARLMLAYRSLSTGAALLSNASPPQVHDGHVAC
jgi:hypothetical protein